MQNRGKSLAGVRARHEQRDFLFEVGVKRFQVIRPAAAQDLFEWLAVHGALLAPLSKNAPASAFFSLSLAPGHSFENPVLLARAFDAVATALLQADADWLAAFHASHRNLFRDRALRARDALSITRRPSLRRFLALLADLAVADRYGLSPVPLPDARLLDAVALLLSPRAPGAQPVPDALRAALDIPLSNKEFL